MNKAIFESNQTIADHKARFCELVQKYLAAEYQATLNCRTVDLRIGQSCPAVDSLGRVFSVISACNPRSQRLDKATNEQRHGQLVHELEKRALEFHPAINGIESLEWQEPSALLVDVGVDLADELAKKYEQNAILSWHAQKPVKLRLYSAKSQCDLESPFIEFAVADQ